MVLILEAISKNKGAMGFKNEIVRLHFSFGTLKSLHRFLHVLITLFYHALSPLNDLFPFYTFPVS